MHIADHLGLSRDQMVDVYYAELLMDAGCTAWTSQLAGFILSDEIVARRELFFYRDTRDPIEMFGWMKEHVAAGAGPGMRVQKGLNFAVHGREFVREGFRNTCEVAQRFASRMGMSDAVQTALLSVFEQWDGSGPGGRSGEAIPVPSRIVFATSFFEALHRVGGRHAAQRLAERQKGSAFDPSVVAAFMAVSDQPGFWEGLEQESVWTTVLALEPESPYRYLREEQLEDIALAFADFADLKSSYSAGHSRRVADMAVRVARRLLFPAHQVTAIRRAALMHDVGLVAVPSYTLERPHDKLTQAEQERLRLHPYHAERILSRVPVLQPVVPLVAAHHERMDGQGYYRGLSSEQIPVGARVIATVDRFDELSHPSPERPSLEPEQALDRLREDAGRGLWSQAVNALAQELGAGALPPAASKRTSHQPAGLTDREVEILRMLARGMSRRDVARALVVSEHTVRHHLEHIYTKIGVGTRVAATLFAVEHDLLR
jgi:HD-GYP domain-containing protein (c-di-GMP phosphodiesterase class II)